MLRKVPHCFPNIVANCAAMLAAAVLLINVSGMAIAQGGDMPPHTILRTVNDIPVSSYDVTARMRLISAGQQLSPEATRRIRGQVLETLIDEQIQLQEAERLGVTVSEAEVQQALGRIEQSNNMPAGGLVKELTARGIDIASLISQVRATLAWRKVVGQRVRSRVQITDADVNAYLEDLKSKGGTEYLLAEIFVSAPRPQDLPKAREAMNELVRQIQRGAQFTSLARQFSQAPTAGAGGDMGWVEAEQLDPTAAVALAGLPVGQITEPLEFSDGYYLYAIRDRRQFGAEGQEEMLYDIRRFYAPFSPSAPRATKVRVYQRALTANKSLNSCADFEPVAKRFGSEGSSLGEIRLGDLPAPLRPLIEKLKPGEKTEVLPLVDGILIMMLCNKRLNKLGLPEPEQVRETLLNRRLDLEARRYLRDLRQNALIEVLDQG